MSVEEIEPGLVGMARGSFGVESVVVELVEIEVVVAKESVVAVLEGTAGKYRSVGTGAADLL